ncbi:HTH-type transcriptional regulator/antitoxin HigA [Catenulispora sp. GAS73]|uniref:ImmA/IrrE family metallo-endopeptidase n=1 Tax=Catenulispora sp. GAS73 TaxID=3156269 RepID=UPI003510DCB8
MTAAADRTYTPEEVLPPGATLQDVLNDRDMTQSDLAVRTGLSTKHINQLVNGNVSLTAETALLLERATGVPAVTWTSLEGLYQVSKSERAETERLESDLDWLEQLPIKELVKRGYISKTSDLVERLRDVCNFFGVANRDSWEAVWEKPTAYRRSRSFTSNPGAVAAWLRIGERRAAKMLCEPYDRTGLLERIDDLRALTRSDGPQEWHDPLLSLCGQVGIAVVFEKEIPGARVAGAARWLTPNKALVQLSLRHSWSDIFWFTFFHEIGHLLLHSKKDVFINDPGPHSGAEQEADAFASQLLIPRKRESRLATLRTSRDVVSFAEELGIGPDIVVGRLQFEQRWPYSRGNDLKRRFVFVDQPGTSA